MIDVLKTLHPKAAKKHYCMFCGCSIEPGETYRRDTLKYNGEVYDWVCHEDCDKLPNLLNMYEDCCCDEGIGPREFQECLADYVRFYYGEDFIKKSGKSNIELVRMVIADYNEPRFVTDRLKTTIANLEQRKKWLGLSASGEERLATLKKELEKYANQAGE